MSVYKSYLRDGSLRWARADLLHKDVEHDLCRGCKDRHTCQALADLAFLRQTFNITAPVYECPNFVGADFCPHCGKVLKALDAGEIEKEEN